MLRGVRRVYSTTYASANARSFEREYKAEYERSIGDPLGYWKEVGEKVLSWDRPFQSSFAGTMGTSLRYYQGGLLNASTNCVDRHLEADGETTAIIWEGDLPTDVRHVSYNDLSDGVNRVANLLKSFGVQAGDSVVIYMPPCPEAAYAMLGCARIGAVHAVVFAGFSSEALRSRIQHVNAKVVITVDSMMRNGRSVPLKQNVDEALLSCANVKNVIVHQRDSSSQLVLGRDVNFDDATSRMRPWCPPESFDSEHPLFVLYTSGSTGAPKGLVHTTGGYLAYAAHSHQKLFDFQRGDIHGCVADIGWITGHTYLVYGPLLNGATTVMFEGVPTYPGPDRYWDMVQRHKINTFYTSPTALKAIAKFGDEPVRKHDLSSLKCLGSVGEPLNAETWRWYYNVVGKGKCSIVDTYWQTETGGAIISPLANVTPMKPGSAALPFFGIQTVVIGSDGKVLEGAGSGVLALKGHWPGLSRTVLGDHVKYLETYFAEHPGYFFTGDGVTRDEDGYIFITGRVDDVLKKAGHRIGTSEIESALLMSSHVAESAVVGIPHEIKGESIVVFAILKDGEKEASGESNLELVADLKAVVRQYVGAIATPDFVVFTDWLPKTRSGKVMRRLLRKIAEGDTSNLGDLSTLNDPQEMQHLIRKSNQVIHHKQEKKHD